jgi:hypothetical protein
VRAADPRLTPTVAVLTRQLAERAPQARDGCIYLGIKLADSERHRAAIARACWMLLRLSPEAAGYGARVARLSRATDSFVFAAYGALDAFAQVAVAVYGVRTAEEVKFPALEGLLAAAAPGGAHGRLRAQVAATCAAAWFRDLRRLRNLVNYRSVIPALVPSARVTDAWAEPPIPPLTRVADLPGYCAVVRRRVAATVEEGMGALAEAARG